MILMRFIAKNSIKIVLTVKLMIVAYIVIDEFDLIKFGENPLVAQDAVPKKDAPKDEPEKPADKVEQDSSEGDDEDVVGQKSRRSFLDDLLSLPKIDTKELKKEELGRYLAMIERKKAQVEDRIKTLRNREKNLIKIEKSIDNKIVKLEEEYTYFKQTLQKEKQIEKDRLDQLITFYQKMEPKKAAPVFEKLDKDLVVALFKQFPQKQTTKILSLMNPDKSVELSEYFGRIRSAKEYELLKEVNTALRKEFDQCKGLPPTSR